MHLDTIETEKPAPFAEAVEASDEVDANRIEPVRDFEQYLEAPLTPEEVAAKADELAQTFIVIDKLDADLEAETASYKAAKGRITGERDEQIAQAKHLARIVREKSDEKLVPCRDEKVFATGMIRTIRLDTGAVVEERAMESDERQAALFPTTDAPESFSTLHEDESEPPQAITVRGEVIEIASGRDTTYDFEIALEGYGTRVRVRDEDGAKVFAVRDHVEMVGSYADNGEPPLFVTSQIQVFDASTEIDATKIATVGDHVEHKANGKRGHRG